MRSAVVPFALAVAVAISWLVPAQPAAAADPLTWSAPISITGGLIEAVSCTSASFCMAGEGTKTFTWNGSTWSAPMTLTGWVQNRLSCGSPTMCWSVGVNGSAHQWNGTSWSSEITLDAAHDINQIDCPAANFCAAATQDGYLAVWHGASWSAFTKPVAIGSYVGLSCVSSTFCAGVGGNGGAARWNGTTWIADIVQGPHFQGGLVKDVACGSTTFCIVVGLQETQTWNGSTWSDNLGDIGSPQSVSCATSSFCVAVGGYSGWVWTGTWSAPSAVGTVVGTKNPFSVSCPTTAFCAAVGLGGLATVGTGASQPATTPTVTVSDNGSTIGAGGNLIFTAAVTGSNGTATGTVHWTLTGPDFTPTCTNSTLSNGNATCTITNAPAGSYTARADYLGDANYTSAFGTDTTAKVSVVPATGVLTAGGHPDVLPTACSCVRPVNTSTGEFWHTFRDLSVSGRGKPLNLSETYTTALASTLGPLGYGWTHAYNMALTFDGSGNATMHAENGSTVTAQKVAASYVFPSFVLASLVANGDGTFTFRRRDGSRYLFSATGLLTAEIDRNGYTTSLAYEAGRLKTVTEPAGRTFTFGYTGDRITSVTDPANHVVGFAYNGANELVTLTNASNHATTFTYDAQHRMLTMTDPRNGETTNTYDGSGRVATQTDPMERTTTFTYSGSTTDVTDERDSVTRYEYTNRMLTSLTKGFGTPEAATWTYGFDPNVLGTQTITDPNDHVTTKTFDDAGNVLTTTDALNHTTTATYNAFGQPLTITDPLNVTTTNVYDASGNLLTTKTPLGGTTSTRTTTYAYADATHPGDVTSATDPTNRTTHFGYDEFGNRTSITNPKNKTATATFDAIGNRLTATDFNQKTTTFTYDAMRYPLTVTDPLTHTTTKTYDENHNLATTLDASDNLTTYEYNADDELTVTTRADDGQETLSYDDAGNVVTRTDANEHTTTSAYDALNRLITTTGPNDQTTTFHYDGAGNRTSSTDALNRVTTYTYDNADRLKTVAYSDGSTPNVTYSYDANDRRTKMVDGTGTTTNTYDTLGRMTKSVNGAARSVSYGYDLAGRLTSITYPNGKKATYGYDENGNLASVKDWLNHTSTFAYDSNGNVTKQVVGSSPTVTDTFAYDDANGLTSILVKTGATTLQGFNYTRTETGLVDTATPTDSAPIDYSYDALDQLKQDAQGTHDYDPAGNLTSFAGAPQTFDDINAIMTAGTGTKAMAFTTNAVGNRTSRAAITGVTTLYSYDQADRLKTIKTQSVLPVVSSIAPNTGNIAGGTTVTINGSGFTGVTSVQFGAQRATNVTFVSDTQLTVVAPAGAGSVDVTVTRAVGTSAAVSADRFTYTGGPAVTSLSPSFIGTKPGPTITINGKGFTGVKKVMFGTVKSPKVTVVSDTKLTAVAPAGAGTVDIRVSNATTTSSKVPADRFAYQRTKPTVKYVNVTSGPANKSTSVLIVGSGFATATAVRFGSKAAVSFMIRSDAVISAVSPATTGSAALSVTNPVVTSADAGTAAKFQYVPSSTTVATYTYNGDGLRTSKKVGSTTTSFTWMRANGMPLLLDDGGASYIYGPGGLPLERINNTTNEIRYMHHDQLGNTTLITSVTGTKLTALTYSSYGKALSGSTSLTPLLFAGQYRDSESGFYYLRARYYDQATGQFMTADPLVELTGTPYAYANNNPVNETDPEGLAANDPAAKPPAPPTPPSFWQLVGEKVKWCKEHPTEALLKFLADVAGLGSRVWRFVLQVGGKLVDYVYGVADHVSIMWQNVRNQLGGTRADQALQYARDADQPPPPPPPPH